MRVPPATMTAAATGLLILVRHGQSDWNLSNRFTGWSDVALTPQGVAEATEAGMLIAASKIRLDAVYTSTLARSIDSATHAIEAMKGLDPDRYGSKPIPVKKRIRLNERHYGSLTGLNKKETMATGGPELLRWRSTLDGRPPPMDERHPHYAAVQESVDERMLAAEGLQTCPLTESMRDCCKRVAPLWQNELRPEILGRGKTILVVGHANNLRALIKCVQGLDDEELSRLGVPNSLPLVYEFDTAGRPLPSGTDPGGAVAPLNGRYLGDYALEFGSMDTSGDGTLSVEELAEAGVCSLIDEAGNPGSSCTQLIEAIDNNGDGRVDFNEYVNWKKARVERSPEL